MIISDLLNKMSEQTPPELRFGNPVPEDALVLGSIPEDLKMLTVTIDSIKKEGIGLMDNLPEDEKSEEYAAAADRISKMKEQSDLLEKIFWYEVKPYIEKDPQIGPLIVSNDWQIYAQEKEPCNCAGCQLKRMLRESSLGAQVITIEL